MIELWCSGARARLQFGYSRSVLQGEQDGKNNALTWQFVRIAIGKRFVLLDEAAARFESCVPVLCVRLRISYWGDVVGKTGGAREPKQGSGV